MTRAERARVRKLPRLPIKAKSSMMKKLSVPQKDYVLGLLAQGRRPAEIRDTVRRELGVEITANAISGYLTHHKDEIVQRKKALADGMDLVHLRHRPARLQELVRMYALLVRQLFREMCPACVGLGTVLRGKAKQKFSGRCETCRGRRWVVPREAEAYQLGDDVGASVLMLLNAPPPLGGDLAVWDKMLAVLREIAELVGDAKVPGTVDPDEAERLADAEMRRAAAKQLLALSPEQFQDVLRRLGERRLAVPIGGDGKGSG